MAKFSQISLLLLCLCASVLYHTYICKCDDSGDIDDAVVEDEEESDCGCGATSRQNAEGGNVKEADDSDAKVAPSQPVEKVLSKKATSSYPRTNQMVYVEGGTFQMGTPNPILIPDGEGPPRKVTVNSFYMDVYEVTNAEFEVFVNSTGYVTEVSTGFLQYYTYKQINRE